MFEFLHLADLHLKARFTRYSSEVAVRLGEARYQSVEHLRARLRSEPGQIRCVIIAGDLFDDGQIRPVDGARIFDFLSSFPVPVIVIPGNHDPYEPAAIWHSEPWRKARVAPLASEGPDPSTSFSGEQPVLRAQASGVVRLLVERVPVRFEDLPDVTFYPCPVFSKTSRDDPTAWIRAYPRGDNDGYRLVIAHGCVMDRDNLPEDDHPISPTAPIDLDVDYVALGHWHGTLVYEAPPVSRRMAYPGVHEPMRFPSGDGGGWRPYSRDSSDRFVDKGPGTALHVAISAPNAAPVITPWTIGHLRWTVLNRAVAGVEDVQAVVDEIGSLAGPERMLLRLTLTGTLPLEALPHLDTLENIQKRFVHAELDPQYHIEPTDAERDAVLGSGIVGRVYRQLRDEAERSSSTSQPGEVSPELAAEAIRLLYEIAREASE